ncbi:MAG: carbamoyl-phosphate synthase / aspartate carbamoyltransferase / dihydroorotase [Microgenomates group bacterium Gr01-1014_5]|nr:MAG: carbamoyl-phosphate synthase / aspartate carbamoyltransferase / dihydroorotase [Microgenomates group bacterium Gr01-1014_5]
MSLKELPGLIDPHVHFRDPGGTHKEDFTTGSEAALAGGIVGIVDMPNNPEPTVSLEALQYKEQIARVKTLCDYGFHFGASPRDNTGEFEKVRDLVAGLKVYMNQTTGDLLIEDDRLIEKVFSVWPKDKPLLVHAEEGTCKRALEMARKTNRRLHICHISLASEIEMIKRAKQEGFPVTCEVTPHHLLLTNEDAVNLGPYGRMKPFLATRTDVEALWENLDSIDMIATDHAPHTKEEKESATPPFGVPGLETAFPLMYSKVVEGKLSLDDLVRLMFEGPKKVFSIKTDNNTFIEIDPDEEYVLTEKDLKTKCGWSAFMGWKLRGRIKRVTIRSSLVFENGQVLVKPGFGQPLSYR